MLAHPASVDTIPTSANQEDHVSMGAIAARHARTVLEHVERIVAIELLSRAEAIDQRLALLADEAAGRADARRPAPASPRRTPGSGPSSRRSTATASPARTSPP